ncbi:uncharacterized protein SAPINGB_P003307 [Magnusiomyces paraingens]|uniref:Vacuolar protein sorting-associated protein 62 n=1 Tax=Magnusiomyces paraingens TaxID=2606893 RepID=A0A5E8BQS8_9ASCO|nr:uncharacterized protein SAPINGB_P003307 [Saprochaete ingens]VVT52070.1 unnamed protein product [Saprochaete ingens]
MARIINALTYFFFLSTFILLSYTAPIEPSRVLSSPSDSAYLKFKNGEIPTYVTDYAPVVHLYAEEKYLPYSIEEFVKHFYVSTANGNNITQKLPLTLADLNIIQKNTNTAPEDIYLTALSNFDSDPNWITGVKNIPDIETGLLKNAPATLIVVDKGEGWVDAFWFYFYSFNLGPFVMGGGPYGNHVGDWEHSLVRFYRGEPQLVWMSAHGGGTAFKFPAMEKVSMKSVTNSSKITKRPVIFSGRGTHANYATVGQHSHDLPYYILSDFTDRGPLWDPAKNFVAYTYDGLKISYANGSEPGREERYGDWLYFLGHWGDKKLAPTDPRQKYSPFEWRYIDGPIGPLDKNLMRTGPCQRYKWYNIFQTCDIRSTLKMGEGIEAEGGGCALAFDNVKPYVLQMLLRLVTWRGWGCNFIDSIFG